MKKIVLIGPVYPYKGGISHYTGLLYKSLNKKYETIMISYKLQYPRFLFKKEQKDFGNKQFKIDQTKFWINTANPINCIISALKILKLKPDLVIFQWWHPYFAPCYWILGKIIGKKSRLLFACHNVFPHERFLLDYRLTKAALKQADYYIVHSRQDEQDLLTLKPNALHRKTVLPTFNVFKIQNLSKTAARRNLELPEDKHILLFFGLVREYKGLKYLLRAMPEVIEKLPDTKLLVVGEFGEDKDSYLQLINEQEIESFVDIYDGYIPDKEVEKFFAACDIVVLPYESATQSGIVQIAYGFSKPVVVTDVGGLPEVVENKKTGYIVEAKRADELSRVICRFFEKDREQEFKDNIDKESYRYSWENIVDLIEDLCHMKENLE